MTSSESNNSNDLEANGIPIEIWQPDLIVLPIPENSPGTKTSTQIRVYITNNARSSFRLNPVKTLVPELMTLDGQVVLPQLFTANEPTTIETNAPSPSFVFRLTRLISNLTSLFKRGDYLIVKPGETRSFSINTRLFWQNNLLTLEFYTRDFKLLQSRHYCFDTLHPGNYQIRFIYLSHYSNIADSNSKKVKTTQETRSGQLATSFSNLYFVQPAVTEQRNTVEVDGIRFETIVSEQLLTIPKQERDAETSVRMGMSITNNTQTPFRFDLFTTLKPEIVTADGQAVKRNYYCWQLQWAKESDFPLAMPGESVTLFPNAKLIWLQRELLGLKIAAGDGGFWIFRNLQPGIYHIRFVYSIYNAPTTNDQKNTNKKMLKWFYKTTVHTPFIELRLLSANR